jgi:NAD(P)-dependent dehydrogenase (short-subunit alcohol dehydrogenase family)
MRFKSKVVLVTGAGQNTGLGLAESFAAEGATVFLNDKSTALLTRALAELRRRGVKKVKAVPADISVPAEVDAMFRQISVTAKRLDVLVNNAAHLGIGPDFLHLSRELFEAVVRVNLVGTFYVSQQAARLMKRQGGGAIVNIGSNVSKRAIRNRAAYVASKGGIDALTLAMAVELAPHGIRVNTVAPGYIRTERWDSLPARTARRRWANVPLGREAAAADIAQAVMFLASDQAARITGTRLLADGGCSAQLYPADVEA